MIEMKSLLLGSVPALAVFAVKTGAGVAYLLTQQRTVVRKIAVPAVCGAGYCVLFLLSYCVCTRVDTIFYFNRLRTLFQSGMAIHIVVAAGMFVWGVFLLRRKHDHSGTSTWGWLPLVVPCPVCGAVVFLSTAFLVSFFPNDSLFVVIEAYGIFTAIMLLTIGALKVFFVSSDASPERALGFSMLFIASYFVFTVLLAPHVTDLHKVYRIAAFDVSGGTVHTERLAGLAVFVVTALGAGFLAQRRRERNT